MSKKRDSDVFKVEKFCRAVTGGPKKKIGQRVLSEHKQLQFPWYDSNNGKMVPKQ